jgi:hypothetical protein
MRRWLFVTIALLTLAPRARAEGQLPPLLPSDCPSLIDLLATAATAADRERVARRLAAMNLHPACLAEALVAADAQKVGFASFLKALENTRTDKQSGASAGSGGSTNLVSKGTTAKVLSFGAEYGALTESVSKQIVTVQGSLDGVPAALVRHSVARYCPSGGAPDCVNSSLIEMLQRFSYAVSFDTGPAAQSVSATPSGTGQGTAQPVAFSADGHSITAVTFRAVLWNARDKVSKTFQSAWLASVTTSPDALNQAATNLMNATGALVATVESDAHYQSWQDETVRQLKAASGKGQVTAVWTERQRVLAEQLRIAHADVFDQAAKERAVLGAYRFEEDAVVAALQKPVVTLQYDYKRPVNQPVTSTVRLIFDKGFSDGWSFTANAAVELYDDTPSAAIQGAGRTRDTQFGVQLQKDLGTSSLLGAAALAGTYFFQYQNSPSIVDVTPSTPGDGITFVGLPSTVTQVFAAAGNIQVAQLRLVLGPGQSSARFPFSISYSNRTELIDKPAWRAQIGVSYDFDSLFGK